MKLLLGFIIALVCSNLQGQEVALSSFGKEEIDNLVTNKIDGLEAAQKFLTALPVNPNESLSNLLFLLQRRRFQGSSQLYVFLLQIEKACSSRVIDVQNQCRISTLQAMYQCTFLHHPKIYPSVEKESVFYRLANIIEKYYRVEVVRSLHIGHNDANSVKGQINSKQASMAPLEIAQDVLYSRYLIVEILHESGYVGAMNMDQILLLNNLGDKTKILIYNDLRCSDELLQKKFDDDFSSMVTSGGWNNLSE